ncbi:sulfite exporter TauE/SafE family protein [Roseovarius autotrophicus]|uniref:sulfite exporter TauE/SafE family protein n=1 Tax=Roseovarius autotrophicus TaxID=2824121 RepID=UPI0019F1E48E|nr:sulfite exporter TauE/SafE family protein [Roseovarius autotrophicus]MBE0452644.1 sulfite exporter TauE/SafE family protein [Roseovarius sp.]
METLFLSLPLWGAVFAVAVSLLAGVIKGMVGFAMPMVMIAGLSTILPPDLALAGLIVPTLLSNLWQALRQGVRAAFASLLRVRVFLIAGGVVMAGSAQMVPALPPAAMFLLIGPMVTLYAAGTLMGRGLRLARGAGRRGEAGMGALAGFFGGISGIWGPPTVAMLVARGTEKREQMRVQGVIYGLGSVLLLVSHLGSGVLRAETVPLSLALVLPALAGTAVGFWLQDKLDQEMFRKLTLCVLLVAGLNLIRRGVLLL